MTNGSGATRHRKTVRRVVPVAVAAVAALLTLGACAPATHSATGHTRHPHPGGGSSPSATPTHTPTPVAVAPPVSRVGVTCAQVAPNAQVNSALGLTMTPSGGLYDVSDLEPYGFTQDGAIMCDYAQGPEDLGFYEVYVVPDVSTTLWNTYAGPDHADLSGYDITPSPFGANTYLDCTASYHDLDCDLDALIGSTFLYIDDYTSTQPTESNAAAEAHMMPVLTSAVNAVKAATVTEPAWTDPNATAVNIPESEAAVGTTLSAALGFTASPSIDGAEELPDPTNATSLVDYPIDFRSYVFDATDFEFQIDVLPKGSWAWPQIVSHTSGLPGYALIPGIGDKALGYAASLTNKPNAGVVEAVKGDNLISVEVDTQTASQIPNLLTIAKKAATSILSQIS